MLFMKIFLTGWSPVSALEAQVYGSRNPSDFAIVKMTFVALRTSGFGKATRGTQCGGLTARTHPEIYFNIDATNCQTIVAEEFGFVTSVPPKCPHVFLWCRRVPID